MATENFSIQPQDGWVQITDIATVAFFRARAFPDTQVWYVTTSATPPAVDEVGYRVDCKDFWVNVSTTEDYYARVVSPRGDKPLRIDVFTIAGA